jgi:hypothetical protein
VNRSRVDSVSNGELAAAATWGRLERAARAAQGYARLCARGDQGAPYCRRTYFQQTYLSESAHNNRSIASRADWRISASICLALDDTNPDTKPGDQWRIGANMSYKQTGKNSELASTNE